MITARIIADSICDHGKRITTFELEYPRFIHSEFLTHRVFSRNAASSRAIPLNKMISLVWNNMAEPIHWGQNKSGMQAKEELPPIKKFLAQKLWKFSGKTVCLFAWIGGKLGLHKQVVNRLLEPWSHIKVVVTATEWDNFFYLRNHPDAQPEIHDLAAKMYVLYSNHKPRFLKEGQWHLPYIEVLGQSIDCPDYLFGVSKGDSLSLEDAIKVSASMCAQVSYRRADDSVEKALSIYNRLIESKPSHASPFEHQATPLKYPREQSGNFRGWKQFRQTIKDNVCLNYNP